MDIHRCRFVPFPSSPINALAISHPFLEKKGSGIQPRLAVGRANGDIEIWNPINIEDGRWLQESIIYGGKNRSIDGLVWVHELDEPYQNHIIHGRSRLFSIGSTTAITEWDLERRVAKHHASGQHGNIWCFALQPFSSETTGTATHKRAPENRLLVAGTIDGSLIGYSIEDDNIAFDHVLIKSPHKKSRVMSITFQSRNVVAVGHSNSTVNIYNVKSRNTIKKITLDYKSVGGSQSIISWAIACVPNARKDIAIGDSSGHLSIFHGKTYSLLQRIHAHRQDILSLTISVDGKTIATGGMDRRTVIYRKSPNDTVRWDKAFHTRYHEHDVKAMVAYHTTKHSVFVAGGPDTAPVVVPFQDAGQEPHLTLPHLPQSVPVDTASNARLVVGWWGREVHIWKIQQPVSDLLPVEETDSDLNHNRKHVAQILVKGEANITSASICDDGSLLVVATALEIKAFRLRTKAASKGEDLRISMVSLPETFHTGSLVVKVSPNGEWLCFTRDASEVYLAKVDRNPDITFKTPLRLARLERAIPKFVTLSGLGTYDRAVSLIAFSPDSKMVAVADLAGFIDTWAFREIIPNGVHQTSNDSGSDSEREDENNTAKAGWTRPPKADHMPKMPSIPVALSFSPHSPHPHNPQPLLNGRSNVFHETEDSQDYILLVVTATGQIRAFHPTSGKLTAWTRRNPYSRFPVQYRKSRDQIKGVVWQGEDRAWLWGTSSLFMFDMSKDFPALEDGDSEDTVVSHSRGRKRKRKGDNNITFHPLGGKIAAVLRPDASSVDENHIQLGNDSINTKKGQKQEWYDLTSVKTRDQSDDVEMDDEDEDEDMEDIAHNSETHLLALRTTQGAGSGGGSDEDDCDNDSKALIRGNGDEIAAAKKKGPVFWHTTKYRPILALLPISSPLKEQEQERKMHVGCKKKESQDLDTVEQKYYEQEGLEEIGGNSQAKRRQHHSQLEVVLIERPLWDIDMPDRYFNEDEWERR